MTAVLLDTIAFAVALTDDPHLPPPAQRTMPRSSTGRIGSLPLLSSDAAFDDLGLARLWA